MVTSISTTDRIAPSLPIVAEDDYDRLRLRLALSTTRDAEFARRVRYARLQLDVTERLRAL